MSSQTVRVDLGDGDWVEVRPEVTYGDRVAVRGKLIGWRIDENGRVGNGPRELDYLAADLEGIRRTVAAWGGPTFCDLEHPHDGDCRPRPITPESIEALPADKGDLVAAAVQKRGPAMGSPGFTTTPLPPSSTAAPAAETAGGSTTSSSSASSAGPGLSS